MSWVAQVGHVMGKDLREARWLIAAYLATVLVSTANAFRWAALSNSLFDISMLFVVGAGVFVVAALVQADSPTRTDAFWASRPFHSSAMLAAKLLLSAVVVAGAALLGQFAVIARLDIPGATTAELLGRSVYAYGMWLIVSMVVAALTRDLRTFVIAVIAIPTAGAIGAVTFSWFPAMSGPARTALAIAAIAGALVLLAALYRMRDLRRRTGIAGIVVVLCAFYSLFGESKGPAPIATPALATRDIGLRLEVPDAKTIAERSRLHLVVRIEDPPTTERLTFIPELVLIRLRDGKTLRVTGPETVTLFTPTLPTATNIQWNASFDVAASNARHEFDTMLTGDVREAMRGGVTSVVIEGTVIAEAPRILATLPLETGASIARHGVRVEVITMGHGLTDTTVVLRETSVRVDERRALESNFFGLGTLSFALLNASRAEARVLYKYGSPRHGGTLVLPGIDLHDETTQFEVTPVGVNHNRPERVADGWMRGASLIVAEWIVRDRYAVRAEASIP